NFYFIEVMYIFFSVMITSIILIDAYNTLGLPTSTTVALVFALLGGAVAMALIKMSSSTNELGIMDYINTSKALAIISGILFSIIIAFFFGTIVQWLARLLFSFNYDNKLKYFGAIFGGISISIIVYFMLIKGLKDASFMTPDLISYIEKNTIKILLICLVASTVLLEVFYLSFKLNPFKVVVLAGTIALAMAFAGNDLVNFIGVPLAGLASFEIFTQSGAESMHSFTMEKLSDTIQAEVYILILAGLIMSVSLWFSKKSQAVIKTSVDLSRQSEGQERFGSSLLARQIVKVAVNTGQRIEHVLPNKLKLSIAKQFEPKVYENPDSTEKPAFDLLRASVSLIVASILIALGTSLKLPLSTTYVTFMVAMATSFADKAWGRESAVYRITGVLSVIGGWFITAFVSFILAGIILLIVYYGQIFAVVGLLILVLVFFIRSNFTTKKSKKSDDETISLVSNTFLDETKSKLLTYIEEIQLLYNDTLDGLFKFKAKKLKKRNKSVDELEKDTKAYKANIYSTLSAVDISFENSGVYYVQMIDYLRESVDCLNVIIKQVYAHVDNNHKELTNSQISELLHINKLCDSYFHHFIEIVNDNNSYEYNKLTLEYEDISMKIAVVREEQIKRIRKKEDPTRASMLVIEILQETENLLDDMQKMIKAYIRFKASF
ncbi:MAG: inorganic phosphate transporter, partial [Bacteroidales bacterium]|nr:inorganic phosphate transporter [Bacteroidales bacterium]